MMKNYLAYVQNSAGSISKCILLVIILVQAYNLESNWQSLIPLMIIAVSQQVFTWTNVDD